MPQPRYTPGGKSTVFRSAEAELVLAVAFVASCRVAKAAVEQDWKMIQLVRTRTKMVDA